MRAYEFIREEDEIQGAAGQQSPMSGGVNAVKTKKDKARRRVEQLIKEARTKNAQGAS